MLNVSNENLIVLKWQKIHVFSNIKFTAIYSKPVEQFTLYSAAAYAEPHQTSEIELISEIVSSSHSLTIFA